MEGPKRIKVDVTWYTATAIRRARLAAALFTKEPDPELERLEQQIEAALKGEK